MIPVILSGGSGTRLWPISRSSFPKQFCDLMDESLQLKTVKRLLPFGSPWTITVINLKMLTERVLREVQVPPEQVIYEPFGRNTAPALAVLCQHLTLKGYEKEAVGVFPADHLIENEFLFHQAVKLAESCALKGQVVTIGIQPTYPATGFGYIELTEKIFSEYNNSGSVHLKALKTKAFREKPNQVTAKTFIEQGNFFWNAGMFVFQVSVMAKHFSTYMPELWNQVSHLKEDLSNLKEIYQQIEPQSVDYGIMEKITDQVCIPCDLGWSDVGSWDEVARLQKNGPNIFEVDGANNFVMPFKDKTYGLAGVDDIIVVDTQDALLVTKREKSQTVKDLLEKIKKSGSPVTNEQTFEYRPWGYFEVLQNAKDFKAKLIRVEPRNQLSYQSHKKRAEHWVVVRGVAEVVLNDQVHTLPAGAAIYIPQGAKHRLRNTTNEEVEVVEVQVGTYFGEDDITRYEDDYKRV